MRASGSRETGNPFLYAELHFSVGSNNDAIGASTYNDESIEMNIGSIHEFDSTTI